QEKRASDRPEDDELRRRILAARAATPGADEKIKRDEHRLPEDEEENEVEGDEHAHQAGARREVEREVGFDVFFDGEARDRADERDDRGEEDHADARAVDADEVLDAERTDP